MYAAQFVTPHFFIITCSLLTLFPLPPTATDDSTPNLFGMYSQILEKGDDFELPTKESIKPIISATCSMITGLFTSPPDILEYFIAWIVIIWFITATTSFWLGKITKL